MRGTGTGNDFYEYRCAVCGKTICTACPEDWAYKRTQGGKGTKLIYCCSWGCFRKLPEKNGVGNKGSRKEEIFALLRAGKNRGEIAEELGITRGTVIYWEQKFPG